MIRLPLPPVIKHCLVEIDNSPTWSVFKFFGSLEGVARGGMITACFLSLCVFTSLPDQTNSAFAQDFNHTLFGLNYITPKANATPTASLDVNSGNDEAFYSLDGISSMLVDKPVYQLASNILYDLPEGDVAFENTKDNLTKPQIINQGTVKSYVISSGDTLTKIFEDAQLPISQAIKLAQMEGGRKFNNLSVGKTLRIYFDENEQWETLEYDLNKLATLIVTPTQDKLEVSSYTKQVEYREYTATGVIESSLSMAAEIAGLPAKNVNALVDIYKWEIDFARDLQKGDAFSVVYQKAFVDGEYIDNGPILAASFTANQQTIDAVRYTDSAGLTAYFRPDGESLRRGFLRTPIKLARITSGFGKRRHPITKTWKKHMGVDYGAKRGTPILATADGVVQYAGIKGGYGKTIILRHGGIYTTLYAHLSKIDKRVRSGRAINQGQVVGYVGRTGWATGDHLHYEFRENGQHKNPLKVKFPKTLPLAKKETAAFSKQAKPLLATLTRLKGVDIAQK